MLAYPLQALLSVRHFREESAERQMRGAELRLRASEEERDRKKQEFLLYQKWHQKEIDRRYDDIMEKELSMDALDKFHAGLAALDMQELEKQQEVDASEKNVLACRQLLDKAKEQLKTAQKNTAKIQTHKDIWSEEAKKEMERAEDLELEEFHPISRKGAEAEGEDA